MSLLHEYFYFSQCLYSILIVFCMYIYYIFLHCATAGIYI